jgi:soluble lytic murein transglycosylase-like protein
MMIGGMANDDSTQSAHASSPAPVATPDDDANRLSVIIQPGSRASSAADRGQNSATIASHVMALAPVINEAARAADVDRALLMAVIDVESGGNPQAVSPKGATGLMQLMPRTGQLHGASDLFDPRQNVAAGARYLKALTRQFGELPLALAAYNAGEGAVQKYGGQIPPYAETMSYVPKVIARYRWYRAMTADGGASLQDASARFLLVRSEPDN